MFRRLYRVLVKEFLQILRDPKMKNVIFGMPVIQMVLFAFALTTDVDRVETALLDMDRGSAARALVRDFTSSGYFEITHQPTSEKELDRLLDQGEVRAVIRIPEGFEKDLRSGRTATVQILTDGTDSSTAGVILGYASDIVGRYSAAWQKERYAQVFGSKDLPAEVELQTRAWFNPNMESRFYFVPGLIAIMLTVVSLQLTSIAIVREKEIGTIEQIMVTPIRALEFILGKSIPFMIIGYIIMTVMLGIALVLFGVKVNGSWLLLYGSSGIFLAGNMGVALLISTSANTQQQALLTAFFFMMPSILLSGYIFPIGNMPDAIQYATMLNPLRWYLYVLRSIVQKGAGLTVLMPALLAQAALAVGFIAIAAARFKKTSG